MCNRIHIGLGWSALWVRCRCVAAAPVKYKLRNIQPHFTGPSRTTRARLPRWCTEPERQTSSYVRVNKWGFARVLFWLCQTGSKRQFEANICHTHHSLTMVMRCQQTQATICCPQCHRVYVTAGWIWTRHKCIDRDNLLWTRPNHILLLLFWHLSIIFSTCYNLLYYKWSL